MFDDYAEKITNNAHVFKLLEFQFLSNQYPNELRVRTVYNNDTVVLRSSYNNSNAVNMLINGGLSHKKIEKMGYAISSRSFQPEWAELSGSRCYYNGQAIKVSSCDFWASEKTVLE
jgi:hypothetical protein